jgi:hypothetical protein
MRHLIQAPGGEASPPFGGRVAGCSVVAITASPPLHNVVNRPSRLSVAERRPHLHSMQWTQQINQLKKREADLVGTLHERYGTFKKVAEKRWCEWRTKLSDWRAKHH